MTAISRRGIGPAMVGLLVLASACQRPTQGPDASMVPRAGSPAQPLAPSARLASPPVVSPTSPALASVPRPLSTKVSGAKCANVSSSEWSAHIDAMLGRGAHPTLIVTGTLGVKPAARLTLKLDPTVMESNPPQYSVSLTIALPTEPTVDMLTRRSIRGEWPVTLPIGAVHIRCGQRIIASIGDIRTAH